MLLVGAIGDTEWSPSPNIVARHECKDCRLLCSYYVIGLTLYMSYGFYLFGYQSLLKPLVHHLSPSHYLYTRCLSFYKGYR
jgi:hypothetical protein